MTFLDSLYLRSGRGEGWVDCGGGIWGGICPIAAKISPTPMFDCVTEAAGEALGQGCFLLELFPSQYQTFSLLKG